MHADKLEFEPAPSSVAAARRFAHSVLEADGVGDDDDDWSVAQVVSELATNAIVHARSAFVLTIACDEEHITVSVTDRQPLARAAIRRLSNETTTGRGLRLVQSLGQAWGVEQTEFDKTVWCDLRRGADLFVDSA